MILTRCTWTWHKLLELRSLVGEFVPSQIQDVTNALFWFGSCLDELDLMMRVRGLLVNVILQ